MVSRYPTGPRVEADPQRMTADVQPRQDEFPFMKHVHDKLRAQFGPDVDVDRLKPPYPNDWANNS